MSETATHILIADRNRHVRDLLRRELAMEGHRVSVARDAREILALLATGETPDILILDPETPYVAEFKLIEEIHRLYPAVLILIHAFQPENFHDLDISNAAAYVEKAEDLKRLKTTIVALRQQSPP
ncbi:response regulator [Desulfobacca acetoxidans]|uniref:Response regulator receiver n=1 Tax=Desulfobacca acetoxidans (strain ATCC 700848 / DSM 11109 / ASRB2) TaxID=880072 RepID=F2NFU1_DESAR|nr:response regulator [Desulfobacca acetoxidans]AEB10210.1 response regulator receiver [Desulfobacca acetoxidans DSM 11109]